ncbi:MAG: N-formylglutamate amidohydrolase [Gammaproteobacteria bacterium]
MSLLAADEPAPFVVERADAPAPFFLTCDHAGTRIPRALGSLGLAPGALETHVGWDIGALAVARALSAHLDATLVWQPYSRLVVDCNRPLASAQLVPARSEVVDVPGNRALDAAARSARFDAIHAPYHATITALLAARAARGQPSVYVAVHSFTPRYAGSARPWHLAILYGSDQRLARALIAGARAAGDLVVGDNEPYRIDAEDYGIPVHALGRGLPNALIEIRQDLLTGAGAAARWAERLAGLLVGALDSLESGDARA